MEFLIEPHQAPPPTAQGDVVVQPPPEVPRDVPGNPVSRLLPVAMVVGTVGMMAVYLTSGASATRNPMFMFFPVMMVGSLLGTMASGSRGGGRVAEINHNRRNYLRYLASLESSILNTADDQRLSLIWSSPDPDLLWTMIGGRRMWERRPDDADFARVRIGLSSQRLSTPLVMPDLGPAEERDPVTAMELRRLFRRCAMVPDLPVSLALKEIASIAVSGDLGAARSMLRAAICQLTLTHGPEDLRIAAVVSPLTAEEWDWLKWLPHHQHPHATDDGGPARLTYTTLSSAESALENCIAHHAVLFIDGGLVTGTESLLTSGPKPCVTVVDLGTACSDTAALRLVVAGDTLTGRSEAGEEVSARPDTMTRGHALAYARRMSRYQQAARDTAALTRVSPSISWPELMGIADVGAIDPAVIWRSTRAPERMLRVPIGVSEHGRPIDLDIKEAATNGMGPHGLCIGATGSGKSVLRL